MPSKKKKYNARFPAGRIKKIMQTDEEVGKVAQAVPVIISRTLELFVESLLTKTLRITNARNAKTLSPSHMKQCIFSESRFDFLRDLVKNIPDIGANEEPLSGSEGGYGNEAGASPASTSTSSSSNGGAGGSGSTLSLVSKETLAVSVATQLQRSESYTPCGSSSSYASALTPQTVIQPTGGGGNLQAQNHLKRTLNHGSSLNFYKEISLEDTASGGTAVGSSNNLNNSSNSSYSNREPPPKLTRLHSAPASNTVPIKIDILPNSGVGAGVGGRQQLGPANSSNFKIRYSSQTAPSTPTIASVQPEQQPVIKLDYSNLQLPMTVGAATTSHQPKQHQSIHQTTNQTRHHQLQQQPTIKIDLSNITNFAPATGGGGAINYIKTEVPLGSGGSSSTPSTPLSTMSIASSPAPSSGSSVSSRNPYMFQSNPTAAVGSSSSNPTAPLFSSVQPSTIPGMDEDYDDI